MKKCESDLTEAGSFKVNHVQSQIVKSVIGL
jgi:hypothetical protein